eukprot:TRINITY_DN21271_c0_g4_i1.p1 TRINITY_DN21271_c0_g4~~TRINITY_DN21271_c0_g4_i1.p1  ORF type:complete len:630 (-),score=36.91 TRINITY_DN21271_c0_g4_i1:140-1771(-)
MKVRSIVIQWRVKRAQSASVVFAHISFLLLAWTIVRLLRLRAWTCPPEIYHESILVYGDLPFMVMVCIISQFFVALPHLVTARSIDIVHCLVALKWISQLMMYPDVQESLFRNGTIANSRFAIGVFLGNAPLTIALNFVVTVVDIFAYHRLTLGLPRPGIADDLSVQTGTVEYYALRETYTLICISVASWLGHSWMISEARATLEAKSSSQVERSLRRVLSAMCDAVACLDQEFKVLEPVPKLAGLLLKCADESAYQGTSFLDLVSNEDKQLIVDCLSETTPQLPNDPIVTDHLLAPTFHIHLKDALGLLVPVQIFYSHFMDIDDRSCFMVGIRDSGDVTQKIPPPSQSPPEPTFAVVKRSRACLSSVCEMGQDVSEYDSSSEYLQGENIEGTTFVCVDAMTLALKILSSSADFAALGGPSDLRRGLMRWIPSEREANHFRDAIQSAVNNKYNHGVFPSDDKLYQFTLRPPGLKKMGRLLTFCATCYIQLEENDCGSANDLHLPDEAPVFSVRIVFTKLVHLTTRQERESDSVRRIGTDTLRL